MSATRFTFTGGQIVVVDASVDEMSDALGRALFDGVLMNIHSPDGRRLVINPLQVQYLQEAPAGQS